MGKILVLNNDLEIGGIQKSLINFLEYLVSQGHEIDLMLWQSGGALREKVPRAVIVIERKYSSTWKIVSQEKNFVKKSRYIVEYLKFNYYAKIIKKPWLIYPTVKQHYNVVISYSQNGYPRFYAIDKVSADKKYLWYHHGSYEYTGAAYKLDKEYYGKFTRLVTVSSANKDMLTNYFPQYTEKLCIVPNIINVKEVVLKSLEEISDFDKSAATYNFVTVARFSKPKGIDLAIDIATKLMNHGLKFRWYFIGDGEDFLEISEAINQRNLGNVCVLLGSKKNPYPYMKLADLYIQTSYVESQCITVYEALILKKLIVATDLPALRDALQKGQLGVLCEPEAMKFANKIMNVLQDKAFQTKLANAVYKHEVSNASAYQTINELLES